MNVVHFLRSLFGASSPPPHRAELDAKIAELKRLRAAGCAQSRRVRDQAEDVFDAARESSARLELPTGP